MSHSAKTVKGGSLWSLLTCILLQNIKKTRGGTLLDIEKFSKKKSHNAEKNSKGGPFSLVRGFVGYVKKVKKNERGTLLH